MGVQVTDKTIFAWKVLGQWGQGMADVLGVGLLMRNFFAFLCTSAASVLAASYVAAPAFNLERHHVRSWATPRCQVQFQRF